MSATARPSRVPCVDQVNTGYLESLLGYNARRAALVIIDLFLQRMAVYDLRPVEFSVVSLIVHNPGITSRQLCGALGLLPPNLVSRVGRLEKRGLIARRPHPSDGRANGLHPTHAGEKLMQEAEKTARNLENDATASLTAAERNSLVRLLKKVYLSSSDKRKNGARDGT